MMEITQKASIYTLNKYFICDANVIRIDGNELYLLITEDVFSELSTDLYVTIYDDVYGLLTYKGKVAEFTKEILSAYEIHYKLKCVLVEMIEVIQRRNNVKVKVTMPTTMVLLDIENRPISDGKTRKVINHNITIKDISASGILFISKEKYTIGQRFLFVFDKCAKPIEIVAEILRTQEHENDFKGYGCKFLNVPEAKEEIVRQFVFKMQILAKKRNSALIWMYPDKVVNGRD